MKTIELISFLIVILSYPTYLVRIWQRKITVPMISWTIWVIMSWSLLLSAISSGVEGSLFAAYAGTTGCTAVFLSSLLNKHEWSFDGWNIACALIGITAMVLWFFTRQDPSTVQYAMYLSLVAEVMGMIPAARKAYAKPEGDRPAVYILFSIGYGITFLAIPSFTLVNCALPATMVLAPALVWIPLVRYRLKNNIPIKEWV